MTWQWVAMMLMSPVIGPAPAAQDTIDFSVADVALTMKLPAGYCLPTGRGAAVAQLVANGDPNAVTHATLYRCGVEPGTGANDYTLIKTPRSMLDATIDRPALIREMGAQFDNPLTVAALAKTDAGADVSRALGTKVEITGEVKPLGHDDVCAYMGGQVSVAGAGTSYLQPAAICITSVGGKILMIARYGKDLAPTAIATLLREARAVALTLRPAATK